MSLLTDKEILDAMKKKEIIITNFKMENLGPDSVDICLGNKIMLSKNVKKTLDPLKKEIDFFENKKINNAGFVLKSKQFILSHTLEAISLSNRYAATIEGRSSLGRYGIMVHMTAGIIHAGFGKKNPSTLTLEIYSVNPNPVILHKGMKIAQLSFFKLGSDVLMGYDNRPNSKYVGQIDPLAPRSYMD